MIKRISFSFLGLIVLPLTLSGQTAPPASEAKPANGATSAPGALSHDLSGVWMQHPDGPVPGVPGMKLHKLEPTWEIGEWFCVVDEDRAYDKVVRLPAGGVSPSSQ